MRLRTSKSTGEIEVHTAVENTMVYNQRNDQACVLRLEEDRFLGKVLVTIHSQEFRQRVNSAGEIEITIGGL